MAVAGMLLLACGLAREARADMITVDADGDRLVGGLSWTFNGQAETNALAGTFTVSTGTGSSFDAYCIDLYHVVYVGSNQYDVAAGPIASFAQSPPSGVGALGGDGAGIGWLYATGEAKILGETGSQAVIDGAGLQVALWKMAYDGLSASPNRLLNLASGNFQFLDSADPNSNQHLVFEAATSFLASYDGTQSDPATFLRVTDHGPDNSLWQDLVAPPMGPSNSSQVTPVPEPSALALAGVGAAVLFALLRRRKRPS
jgi:PEP-CTERM motif